MPTLEDARKEALLSALELMEDRIKQGHDPDESQFEICDEKGAILLIVPFESAVHSHEMKPKNTSR